MGSLSPAKHSGGVTEHMFGILSGWDQHGFDHGQTFRPIEQDPKEIYDSMKQGTTLDLSASCRLNPWNGHSTCTGPGFSTSKSRSDGWYGNGGPKAVQAAY